MKCAYSCSSAWSSGEHGKNTYCQHCAAKEPVRSESSMLCRASPCRSAKGQPSVEKSADWLPRAPHPWLRDYPPWWECSAPVHFPPPELHPVHALLLPAQSTPASSEWLFKVPCQVQPYRTKALAVQSHFTDQFSVGKSMVGEAVQELSLVILQVLALRFTCLVHPRQGWGALWHSLCFRRGTSTMALLNYSSQPPRKLTYRSNTFRWSPWLFLVISNSSNGWAISSHNL